MSKSIKCSKCGKTFAKARDCNKHARDKHSGRARPKPRIVDDEPSIAMQMIDAGLQRSMGEEADAWLLDMLP